MSASPLIATIEVREWGDRATARRQDGALPPIGYRIVKAAEQRGHGTKKSLEIDPIQAETVRSIFRFAREGNGSSGPMGVKSIAKHLNEARIRTRDGGRWGVDAVHKVLTRTTYIGRHRFNTKYWKTRERKPETFACGGLRSFFDPNVGRSFRNPAVQIAQTPPPGSPIDFALRR
jgi:hypothetical protein